MEFKRHRYILWKTTVIKGLWNIAYPYRPCKLRSLSDALEYRLWWGFLTGNRCVLAQFPPVPCVYLTVCVVCQDPWVSSKLPVLINFHLLKLHWHYPKQSDWLVLPLFGNVQHTHLHIHKSQIDTHIVQNTILRL